MSITLFRIVRVTIILFAFGLSELNAQTMFILKENGLILSNNVSTIQKITFSESDIVLYKTDGKSEFYSDTIIRYMNFKNLKSIKSDAGMALTVKEGDKVTLDGMASSGPFDDALMFNWSAPGGILLSSPTVSKPTFTAPEVTKDTIFVFKLYVSDGRNISEMDSVNITVLNVTGENPIPSEVELTDFANSIYPSLVSDVVNIDNRNVHYRTFSLYNDQGQCLQTGTLIGGINKVTLAVSTSGLLIMHLQGDTQHLDVKLIKK